MERNEFLPCLYRDENGQVSETPWPRGEPYRKTMPRDLYCPFYNVKKAWIGPTRITEIGVFIYNRPAYRRDTALVDLARERLIRTIQTRESPDMIAASGGIDNLQRRAEAQELFL